MRLWGYLNMPLETFRMLKKRYISQSRKTRPYLNRTFFWPEAEELQALGNRTQAKARLKATLILLEKELDSHPDNAGALAFGAAVLANLGKHDRAKVWADWALAIASDDGLVHYNIARTLCQLEKAFSVPASLQNRLARWIKHDEDFLALKGEASFRQLLQLSEREVHVGHRHLAGCDHSEYPAG